jgi:hypothetical protein
MKSYQKITHHIKTASAIIEGCNADAFSVWISRVNVRLASELILRI